MSDAALVAIILVVGMFGLMAIGVSVSVSIGLPSAICLVILMGHDSGIFTSAQKIYTVSTRSRCWRSPCSCWLGRS